MKHQKILDEAQSGYQHALINEASEEDNRIKEQLTLQKESLEQFSASISKMFKSGLIDTLEYEKLNSTLSKYIKKYNRYRKRLEN